MKKLLLCLLMTAVLFACHRPRVKHDHRTQMPRVHVAKDSAQRNDINENTDESWRDEDLVTIPDMPEDAKAEAHPETMEEIEKILSGKE